MIGTRRGLGFLAFASMVTIACGHGRAQTYADGRPAAIMRLDAQDSGVVLRHGPEAFDSIGARDVWVSADHGRFYMHYDAAGPTGWLCALAVSDDLLHWRKQGLVMQLGAPGTPDAGSASYCTTYHAGAVWYQFYLGAARTTPPPDRVPMVPFVTLAAVETSPRGPARKRYDIVPFRPTPGTFYADVASPGFIVRQGEEYLQFFSGAALIGRNAEVLRRLWTGQSVDVSGADLSDIRFQRTIGLARTRSLDAAWAVDARPVVPATEQVENTSLYYEPVNRTWFLFTDHVGYDPTVGGHEYTDAIWVYWTDDLTRWDPRRKAVVLDGRNCAWSRRVHGVPSVIPADGRLALFYDGVAGDGTGDVGRDIGLAWLTLPLRPPSPPDAAVEER